MPRILLIVFLVGILSGCQTDTRIPSHWNSEYERYMREIGYTYNENDGFVSKNNIPIWLLPINCFRCITTYIGPDGLYDDLLKDYNKSLERSIEMYRQEKMQILELES